MVKSIRNLSSVTVVGLDIAKNVFQVHGVDAGGASVVAKAVRRGQLLRFFSSLPPCLVGIEACSSVHHWARSLIALGHQVKLIPPAYVKPYVRRNKNDAVDAAAICEAVGRSNMRFVPVRSVENQAHLMRHRARELLAGNRTRMFFDSHKIARRKPRVLRTLAEKLRIMAAMPQLSHRESNKQCEMIRCQIKEMAPAAGIS